MFRSSRCNSPRRGVARLQLVAPAAAFTAIVASLVAASPLAAQSTSTISVTVDATRVPDGIVKTHERIPVKPGPLTIYYPKWIPGEHQPSGPIANVTGLKFTADGKVIPWLRDPLDVYTFHLDVPASVSQLDAEFDFLEPGGGGGFATGAASSSAKLAVISWNQNVLYPAGTPASQLTFAAKLVLPEGWKHGTPLAAEGESGREISFKPVSLERLVDSPVIAGAYYRAIDLTPPGEPVHHEIDIAADSEAALTMSPEVQHEMTNLVAESGKLFGSRHYREYHFLLTLSDHVAHFGLEHHECNDSRLPERVLLSPGAAHSLGGLLAHEFAHSWSGKFRRPAGLATPDYEKPMETDLLWDYEGFTDFAGPLLAARSGLWSADDYRANLAAIAADLGPGRPGRTWRPLQDTATGEIALDFARGWTNWRRGSDYYDEGDLLWLEVASIIHRESHGAKSIDDFAQLFYGGPNNGPELKPYSFDDVVAALNRIAPYDWAKFLRDRLDSTSSDAPTGGITNSGWKAVLAGEPPHGEARHAGAAGDAFSIGLQLGPNGDVGDAIVGGPAFNAGVSSGMKVVGVNGRVYTHDVLEDAINAAKGNSQPIELLVVVDDYYETVKVDYHGGQRFPQLVRDDSQPDYLDELAKPRAAM
jgi:predicted metalloprotease with PDZ domain